MRAKLVLLLVSGAAVSTALLVVRQQRLEAVHDMTRALERAGELDRSLWTLRAEIARRVTPQQVQVMAEKLGPLSPIPREACPPQNTPGFEPSRPRVVPTADARR